jgi:hypothetical protein
MIHTGPFKSVSCTREIVATVSSFLRGTSDAIEAQMPQFYVLAISNKGNRIRKASLAALKCNTNIYSRLAVFPCLLNTDGGPKRHD